MVVILVTGFGETCIPRKVYIPLKINMEHKKWRFCSDDLPFQLGVFLVQHVNLPGCTSSKGLHVLLDS